MGALASGNRFVRCCWRTRKTRIKWPGFGQPILVGRPVDNFSQHLGRKCVFNQSWARLRQSPYAVCSGCINSVAGMASPLVGLASMPVVFLRPSGCVGMFPRRPVAVRGPSDSIRGPPPAAAQTPDGARTGRRTAPAAVRPRTAADGSSDGPRTEAWPRCGRGGARIPAASRSVPGAAARRAAPCCTAPALPCGPGSPYTENNLLFPGSLTAVGARGASERGCRGGGAACARVRGRAVRLLARRGAATVRRGLAYLHARPRGRRRRVMK
jgi:hypothetical protein